MSDKRLKELKKLCAEQNIELIERPNGHYQIKGQLLVNYYPLSEKCSAYIAGTTRRHLHVKPKEAVEMAFKEVQRASYARLDERGGLDKVKIRLKWKLKQLKSNPVCCWCGNILTRENATVEHVIPLKRGGLDNPCNWKLACEFCNKERGHQMPEMKILVNSILR
jgi:5-methylcytosine-specific restriction endonuclease McrA